jgi:FAD/FMN-containing dehydrogenase
MPFFVQRYGDKAVELMREVKKVYDPNNILNPNVMQGV